MLGPYREELPCSKTCKHASFMQLLAHRSHMMSAEEHNKLGPPRTEVSLLMLMQDNAELAWHPL